MTKKDEIYEALTIQALRIVDLMRKIDADADIIQNEFKGDEYEY